MGTRFMATKEAPIHDAIKQEIVKANERDTALIMRSFRNTSRIFKVSVFERESLTLTQNSIAQQVIEIEKTSSTPDFKKIQPLVAGARGRRVFTDGDRDAGVWTAGQVVGLIDDVPSCDELLSKIEKVIHGLSKLISGC
jgi:NADH:quinone reductase (non-electrogenic)